MKGRRHFMIMHNYESHVVEQPNVRKYLLHNIMLRAHYVSHTPIKYHHVAFLICFFHCTFR